MSYIKPVTSPLINLKLTEIGRRKIAMGAINYSYWAIGDSEVTYENDGQYLDTNVTVNKSKILKPKDRQPNLKHYLLKSDGSSLQSIEAAEFESKSVKIQLAENNPVSRGFYFYDGNGVLKRRTNSKYYKCAGFLSINQINGSNQLILECQNVVIGDFITIDLQQLTIPSITTANIADYSTMDNSSVILTFKIMAITGTPGSYVVTLDRTLPTQTPNGTYVKFFLINENFSYYDEACTTAYWDKGSLSFEPGCGVSIKDVPVFNYNSVFCESVAGSSAGVDGQELYKSNDYFASYKYLGYDCITDDKFTEKCDNCNEQFFSVEDSGNTAVAIIHYTNNMISNAYGEYFHIDGDNDKLTTVTLPSIMWHNRLNNVGEYKTGMTFVSDVNRRVVDGSKIYYYDLIEDATLSQSAEPKVVGRVYPELHLITFHNKEIVAALSYISNRNFTLPSLAAELVPSANGISNGFLKPNQAVFLTYMLVPENNTISGLRNYLPCQSMTKIYNASSIDRDVAFRMEDTGRLQYMKELTTPYIADRFYATSFKLMYQIVDDPNGRPLPDAWKEVDFTSNVISTTPTPSVIPSKLEEQSYTTSGFVLTANSTAMDFDILNYMPQFPQNGNSVGEDGQLQFGEEYAFDGLVTTYIGATVFKTFFSISIPSGTFVDSTNPTKDLENQNLRLTEFGIYDDELDLVLIGKLSQQVTLAPNNSIIIEASIDF